MKTFPLIFRVRTLKPQIIEKPRLFSLFSFFFSKFLQHAALVLGRKAFPDRLTSTRPALHTSTFTVDIYEDYAGGTFRFFKGLLCTSKVVKNSSMSSTVVFYTV